MRCLPSLLFLFLLATCQFDWCIATKNETMETSQNKRLYFEVYTSSPFAYLYKWKEDTIFQGIWDISEVVWRTCWGKHCEIREHIGNPLGTWRNIVWTHWEARKYEKILPQTPPKHKREKSKAPWVHAWAFPLAAWNFSSQKTWSPFLAWANTPCKEHPTYSVLGQIWFINK